MKVIINKNSWFIECGFFEIPYSIHDSMRYSDQGPLLFKQVDQSGSEYLPFMKAHSEFYDRYGFCDILHGRYNDQDFFYNKRLFRVYRTKIVRSKPPTNPAVPIYVYLDKSDEQVFVRQLNPGVAFTINERSLRGKIFMKIKVGIALIGQYNSISLTDGVLCYIPTDMLVETVGYELVTV